jgi:precorrin-6A/cobalt-precorrin-6A reductase
MDPRILILGGTTEARQLAGHLAGREGYSITLSLAGRTARPLPHPVPLRVGGFGGAAGLAAYLRMENIDLLVDATHPHAAQISQNAIEAAAAAKVAFIALRRPAWHRQDGDRWIEVADVVAARDALGDTPAKIFVAVGRSGLEALLAAPQHDYLIRSVEPVTPPLALPNVRYILDRGPFDDAAERRLLETNHIAMIVAKNSGGGAAYGKIAAARALGIPVVMIGRPAQPEVACADTVETALAMIDHALTLAAKRGV